MLYAHYRRQNARLTKINIAGCAKSIIDHASREGSKPGGRPEAIDAATVVTPRANCRTMLEERIKHCRMDVAVLGLPELVAEYPADDGAG